MRKKLLTCMLALSAAVAVPRVAKAHHGWVEFDSSASVTLQGIVTDFHYTNPHCVVDFDVKDDKGQVRKWQGEFASPPELSKNGWTAATLQPGDKLSITGHPERKGALALHVMSIRQNG